MDGPLFLHILPDRSDDDEEIDSLTALLRTEILDLDVVSAEPVAQAHMPADSKGVVAAAGGWLAVNLGREALKSLVNRVLEWANRANKSVEISFGGETLKVTGVSQTQQDRLIDEWIRRQSPST